MLEKASKGVLTALLVVGLLLPGKPTLAEAQEGVVEVLEVTTDLTTNVTTSTATLHGYLHGMSEYGAEVSRSEPARFALTNEAASAVTSVEDLDIEEHALVAAASRLRRVNLAPWVAGHDGIEVGDELVLNLFPDASYLAIIDRVSTNMQGTVSVRGRVAESAGGYMLMSTHDKRTFASVRIPADNLHYIVLYEPQSGEHYVIQLNPDKIDELPPSPPLVSPSTEQDERTETAVLQKQRTAALAHEDPATIDVMIVYTKAAEQWADLNNGGIDNVIAQAMARAQLVLDNSHTGAYMRLVHSARVDYDESLAGYGTHLSRLTGRDDGHMDEVHEWRDEYGADLVALFAELHDVGGVAWLLGNAAGSPDGGFSMTRVQQAATGYTHIHEMGHNMGLHHHKEQNYQPGPTSWAYWPENTWSAGWRWTGHDGDHYCSVMSYSRGEYFDDGRDHVRVPYFSNPDILYEGEPAGHPVDGDNARTVREIKHVVAAYRESVVGDVVSFEWWSDPAHTKYTSSQAMSAPGPFSAGLVRLKPDTTYYYRARAIAGHVVAYGDEMEFSTEAAVPTEILDWFGLDAIRDNLSGTYILMNDLDSTTDGYAELASPAANDAKGWRPIGAFGNPFTGTFDGQGCKIRDLFVNRPNDDSMGLFGAIEGGAASTLSMCWMQM